ncbi:MAG TPA: arginyltransferase [Sphingomonadales bacterium]|nr:arginyltransferase [Sphingomonadales bacterium]
MNDQSHPLHKFYITAPSPCPYVIGKLERKVFTDLDGPDAAAKHESFNHIGFRRSQNIVYRPACDSCRSCISVRVVTKTFRMGRSMRRTHNRFRHLAVADEDAAATYEQFDLLKRYIASRHATGGMAGMDEFEYADMVELSPVTTRLVEYRAAPPRGAKRQKGSLAGAALTDVLSDGLSLVYSFYRTERAFAGFGTFIILDHILRAREAGLPYVYLGYWVKESKAMAYKARFQPLEFLERGGWRPFDPAAF